MEDQFADLYPDVAAAASDVDDVKANLIYLPLPD